VYLFLIRNFILFVPFAVIFLGFFWVAALPYDHRGEIHFGVADPTVHMSDGLFVGGSE
jgi:hypothetical protein